jgi:prephenate dehydrogenase
VTEQAAEGRREAVQGPVLVIGTGLIGASVALALRRAGVDVLLSDADAENLRIAREAGAGRVLESDDVPALVVVAVPPRSAAAVLADASRRHPAATLTDVTSVKEGVITEAVAAGADPRRTVGGHPMAGREVSGSAGARKELLDDRLWVITPLPDSAPEHVARVRRLAETCGAVPVEMSLAEHDAAVALVSHAPQVLSSVLAGRLADYEAEYVRIAGQGLRDMTRIAASNADLWSDILAANAGQVADVLDGVIADLVRTQAALRAVEAGEAAGEEQVRGVLEAGRAGQSLIPGKHGAPTADFREITVQIADKPGELGRLFSAVGVAQVNLEDLRIEHVLGRPSGLVALYVQPTAADRLREALQALSFDVRS